MPFSKYLEEGALGLYFGDTTTGAGTPPATYEVGLVLQCFQLSTSLTAGTAYTSLACATDTVAYAIASGDTILIGTGSTTQAVVASAAAAVGATSISVNSFIANATYAVGTPGIRCDVYATAQEVSTTSTGYARVAVTNSTTNFNTPSGGSPASVTNKTAITFPQATASWGTVAGFLLGDNATLGSGNIWGYGMLNAAQVISVNNTPSFAAGALTITLY